MEGIPFRQVHLGTLWSIRYVERQQFWYSRMHTPARVWAQVHKELVSQRWFAGWVRKREQMMSMCRNGEWFVKVKNLKVPDASIAALLNTSLSSTECEQLCLNNCSCKAYASLDIETKGVGCLTWYGQLRDTAQYSKGRELYVSVDAVEVRHSFSCLAIDA